MSSFSRRLSVALVLALPGAAIAQDAGHGFLFGAPIGAFTFHAGWAAARARSDLFAFTTDQLTLDRGDFSSPSIGMDIAINASRRTQIVLSGELSGVDRHSEFRKYIDNNDQPIEQSTTFSRLPVTLSVKQYLTSTGRSIGKLAWIPTRAAAYVGAGAGMEYYQFNQEGDFVDFETLNVFHDTFSSDGWAPIAHALAGFDYTLSPHLAITTEARYVWSRGSLTHDFSGFTPIDLSGFGTTLGLTVRF
jgi:hypothetical protein